MFGGVAAAAAVRTFPFRVFSFPKEIVVAPPLVSIAFRVIAPPPGAICGAWRVPPHKIGDLSKGTFSNIEQQKHRVCHRLLDRTAVRFRV